MRIIFLSLLLFIANINAEEFDFEQLDYKVLKGESLSRILRRFVKEETILTGRSPTVTETFLANPDIKTQVDWKNLKEDQVIKLRLEKSVVDYNKFKQYVPILIVDNSKSEDRPTEYVGDSKSSNKNFKASLFYMASLGNFSQTANSYPNVTFSQNSFVSFGTSLTYLPRNKSWAYSGSLYLSQLESTGSNLNDSQVTIPKEIGGNLYVEKFFNEYKLNLYGGIDYDSFSTFNYSAINDLDKIFIDKNSNTYLTLGISKNISLFEKNFYTKISFSKSILGSYQTDYTSSTYNGKLSGIKGMFYINHKFSDSFYVHSFLKYHSFSGDYSLNIFRIGIGFGFILF